MRRTGDAAAAREVRMTVEGVLTAAVALAAAGKPEAVRVVVLSAEEAAAGKDAWRTSDHQVFRWAFCLSCFDAEKYILDAKYHGCPLLNDIYQLAIDSGIHEAELYDASAYRVCAFAVYLQ